MRVDGCLRGFLRRVELAKPRGVPVRRQGYAHQILVAESPPPQSTLRAEALDLIRQFAPPSPLMAPPSLAVWRGSEIQTCVQMVVPDSPPRRDEPECWPSTRTDPRRHKRPGTSQQHWSRLEVRQKVP